MLGHILVNGVAASVHMTEDYKHEHNVEHTHLFSNDKHVINDDCQHHEHAERAHMHAEFQLSDMATIGFTQYAISRYIDMQPSFPTLALSPPVPPPTH